MGRTSWITWAVVAMVVLAAVVFAVAFLMEPDDDGLQDREQEEAMEEEGDGQQEDWVTKASGAHNRIMFDDEVT